MIYPSNFESRIGFDIIRRKITGYCLSSLGTDKCTQMAFSSQFNDVEQRLKLTHEFLSILQSKRDFPTDNISDARPAIKSIATPGSFITADNLNSIYKSLRTIEQIIIFFRSSTDTPTPYPNLARLAQTMLTFPEITTEAERVLDKFGNIKDNASPNLATLRSALVSLNAGINTTMRRVIAQGKANGYLDADVTPSIRDGRLVLPVAPAHKRKLKGIVHDESASGKTIFIEPEEIVETNNRIRETEAEISREIIRILTHVADIIRPYSTDLLNCYDTLGHFDFIRAKACFALEIDAQMPHLHHEPIIELYHAIHPALFLSLKQHGKQVVPLNITLDKDNRILLISGPNAGGKSVCLKTVGVTQYMMQCGILPPIYNNSHMGIFNSIFIDIGDQQSIEDDLSTYSSHLYNMKSILAHGTHRSLILIDEFGSGTEPQIGGAIAQAILAEINNKRMFGLITTHYQNLKQFAQDSQGIINGAMLYDRQRMTPLFQLSIGYPGSSFAIEIARKIGLPATIVDHAQEIVGSDYVNLDKYLLDIARDRKYWENKRHEVHIKEKKLDSIISNYNDRLDSLSQEQKAIIKEAKSEAKELLRQSNAQIENTIREIKNAQAEREQTNQLRQQLEEFKHRLESNDTDSATRISKLRPTSKKKSRAKTSDKPNANTPLTVGDNVMLQGGDSVGTITEINGTQAMVTFGNIKTRMPLANLQRTMKKVPKASTQSVFTTATTDSSHNRRLNFKQEIDVRGMRTDEAVQSVTYFIDDAIQFSMHRVRILHGTGTGVLRDVIRQYLRTVPGVSSAHDEDVRLGGAGITVVNLD